MLMKQAPTRSLLAPFIAWKNVNIEVHVWFCALLKLYASWLGYPSCRLRQSRLWCKSDRIIEGVASCTELVHSRHPNRRQYISIKNITHSISLFHPGPKDDEAGAGLFRFWHNFTCNRRLWIFISTISCASTPKSMLQMQRLKFRMGKTLKVGCSHSANIFHSLV